MTNFLNKLHSDFYWKIIFSVQLASMVISMIAPSRFQMKLLALNTFVGRTLQEPFLQW